MIYYHWYNVLYICSYCYFSCRCCCRCCRRCYCCWVMSHYQQPITDIDLVTTRYAVWHHPFIHYQTCVIMIIYLVHLHSITADILNLVGSMPIKVHRSNRWRTITQNANLSSFLPQSISLCNCKWKWIKIVYLLDRYCIDKKHKLYIHPNCNG